MSTPTPSSSGWWGAFGLGQPPTSPPWFKFNSADYPGMSLEDVKISMAMALGIAPVSLVLREVPPPATGGFR